MGHMNMTKSPNAYLNKLPMVTALFWAIKIVATTLGESVSNYFAITPLKLGYAVSAGIFVVMFAVALIVQMKADRFRPAVFWYVILATSILGTSVSDLMNRTFHLGYTGGFTVLTTLLIVALVVPGVPGQLPGPHRRHAADPRRSQPDDDQRHRAVLDRLRPEDRKSTRLNSSHSQ